jgi:hypothetical protein
MVADEEMLRAGRTLEFGRPGTAAKRVADAERFAVQFIDR